MNNKIYILNSKNITKGFWSYIIALIYIEPAFFQHINYLDDIFKILQLLFFIIIFIFRVENLVKNIRIRKYLSIDIWITIYYMYLIIITFINHGEVISVCTQAIQFLGFAMYLELVMEYTPIQLYIVINKILTIYVILNFVSLWIFPNGMYTTSYFTLNYFFGYANQNINFMLPVMMLTLLKHIYYKKCTFQILIVYSICIFTSIKVWSGASLIVTITMAIFAILCMYKKGKFIETYISGKLLNFYNLLCINIVAFIGLVFFNIQYHFEYFITQILKKSLTLTNRTTIWQRNIKFIKKNIIFGYGKENYEKRAIKLGFKSTYAAGLHAHNRFLETMYRGGVILESIYAVLLFKTAHSLGKFKNTAASKIIAFSIFLYMCGMLTEFYDYCIFFFAFMVLAENCNKLICKREADSIYDK